MFIHRLYPSVKNYPEDPYCIALPEYFDFRHENANNTHHIIYSSIYYIFKLPYPFRIYMTVVPGGYTDVTRTARPILGQPGLILRRSVPLSGNRLLVTGRLDPHRLCPRCVI